MSNTARLLLDRIRYGPALLGFRAMPWLMRFTTCASAALVAFWIAFAPFAALDVGRFTIDGERVSGPYFLAHAYPVMLPFLALLAALAYGYWTEARWARPLPIVFWAGVDVLLVRQIRVGDVAGLDAIGFMISAMAYVAFAVWYCYFKRTVGSYYRALARARMRAVTTRVGPVSTHEETT
jgi:hypothetical protein